MMPFFGQPEPSEEEKEEAIRQYMKRLDFHNGLQEWMLTMTAHQLWMMRILFGTVARANDAAGAALLHEGIFIGHLQHKGGCEECHIDHLKAELEAGAPFQEKREGVPVGLGVPDQLGSDVHKGLSDKYREYSVAPVTDDPSDPRVYCNRPPSPCGMKWPTFADREANGGPDECPVCRNRTKFG